MYGLREVWVIYEVFNCNVIFPQGKFPQIRYVSAKNGIALSAHFVTSKEKLSIPLRILKEKESRKYNRPMGM